MARSKSTLKNNKGKIAICHYRVGGTDGVSLEINKRKKTLEQMGYTVKLIGGEKSKNADYIIPELEFDRPDIFKIRYNAFEKLRDFKTEQNLINYINKIADRIKKNFLKIHKKEQFKYLYAHNIFSHGRHIAAAKSFYDIKQETNIKIIAVDHDFYISYGDMYITKLKAIKKYLNTYVPPRDSKIKHITINSITQKKLKQKWGLDSMVFPDTWDFDQPSWKKDKFNANFLKEFGIKDNDLIILQATRIVERKAIELAMDIVKNIQDNKNLLIGQTLYNGKKITKDSKIIFLLAGYIEPASKEYGKKLKQLAKKNHIKALFIGDHIKEKRELGKKEDKIYSLWDAYVYADMITYPSIWEGWGNQFLEALFAKKPIITFEYPVFKADIKKEGCWIISLGDKKRIQRKTQLVKISQKQTQKTTSELIKSLINKRKTLKLLEKNFKTANQYHGNKTLKKLLKRTLNFNS